jgi:hypothetical protein
MMVPSSPDRYRLPDCPGLPRHPGCGCKPIQAEESNLAGWGQISDSGRSNWRNSMGAP